MKPGTGAPKVTVGLPVFNGEKFLAGALNSLLAQDFDDFELIVSDNGSTDSTEQICRSYAAADPRIRYMREDANKGAAWNFNRLVDVARGHYFRWAAHDDECDPLYLSRCVAALEGDSGAVLAWPKTVQIDDSGVPIGEVREDPIAGDLNPSGRYGDVLQYQGHCHAVFGLIRTDALRATGKIGPYSESDWVLLAELALHGRFHPVSEPLLRWRDHPGRSVHRYRGRASDLWFRGGPAGWFTFPAYRQVLELVKAIHRAPITLRQRLMCYGQLRHWMRRKGFRLLTNLPGAVRDALVGVTR